MVSSVEKYKLGKNEWVSWVDMLFAVLILVVSEGLNREKCKQKFRYFSISQTLGDTYPCILIFSFIHLDLDEGIHSASMGCGEDGVNSTEF